MTYRLEYHQNPGLPRLAWLASVDQTSGLVTVVHGPRVECRDRWLVEGAWTGDFDRGDFHQSEAFFGSGVRTSGDKLYFAASTASVDRLVFCQEEGRIIVSNSLLLLLAHTGANLDDNHDYWRECLSIFKGPDRFDRRFKVIHPRIEWFNQVFYDNMVVSDGRVSFEARTKEPAIDSFDTYHRLITGALAAIKVNAESGDRTTPLESFTMVSVGYDSTAVSCLVKPLGVTRAFGAELIHQPFSFLLENGWREDARPIAEAIGLDLMPRDGRRSSITDDELYFLSTNYPRRHSGHWSEVGHHAMARHIEQKTPGAVVFSGYHGDLLWGVGTHPKYISRRIRRQCLSGLNLTEIRLKSGFINVAVPFIYANNIADIQEVTHSGEMAPWRLGGDYDRPIPRRIAEECGVKRGTFALEKKWVADRYIWPINSRLRREFLRYLNRKFDIKPVRVYLEYATNFRLVKRSFGKLGVSKARRDYYLFDESIDFYYLMAHWATRKLTGRLKATLAQN